jgi:tRNA-specific 2-thiouridylase
MRACLSAARHGSSTDQGFDFWMSRRIAVAVSGGVDSLTAAYLLKQEFDEIIAIHFLTGFEDVLPGRATHLVRTIGERLHIPLHVLDLSATFKNEVVDYFTATYLSGETPNPCIICNPTIKFGVVLRYAEELGAEALATGHYAIIQEDSSGRYRLFKGVDSFKDQSYFLSRLTQTQLSKACFPLGPLTKSAVKALAADHGFEAPSSSESQDVCFIKDRTYKEFISTLTGRGFEPGLIETAAGEVVGEHRGLHRFTVGQRRGINCPAAEPYYVLRLDTARNRLVVGSKEDLVSAECRVVNINWIAVPPTAPRRVRTRVRYRTPECASSLVPLDPETALVRFDSPQAAVTPGQAAVFYEGNEVLGGGFISADQHSGWDTDCHA